MVEHTGAQSGIHDPGSHLHAVEGQGQQHGEHVHVVHVVLVTGILAVPLVAVVIVVRTGPESGQAHVFVELVVQADGGHVIVEDLGSIGGEAGQGQALDTHADLQVGLRHHPVDVGALQFHHAVVVSTQGAAGVILAPDLVADFEEHGTGQGFRSHGVQLQADTLAGFEFVFILVAGAGLAVLVGTEVGMLTIVERHDPLALGLEVDSVGAGSGTQHHSGSQSESHKLLHDNTFLHYFRIFRSRPLRDLFPLRDPIPALCGAEQGSRPVRPEQKLVVESPRHASLLARRTCKNF